MAPGRPDLRWAAKVRAAAAFFLAGAVAGTGLYFGNLAYVTPVTPVTPIVQVNKAAIQSGDHVIIIGAGFKPGETAYIDLVGRTPVYQIGKVAVRPDGDWGPIDATITEGSPGPSSYSIVATGQTGDTASASISIRVYILASER